MGFYQGIPIGLMGTLEKSVSFSEFCIDLEDKLNDKVKSYKFSDKPVTKIAMITGQGQSGIPEADCRF